MSNGIALVLGTRPEIIKLAPVIQACERRSVPHTLIHTGQHYSETLDSVFFDQLGLPDPDYNLGVGSADHGKQTGEMLIGVERILQECDPETVLVQGDTNSVLAGALAASKLDVRLGHVEAGLRSGDREMPEETNRTLADHAADRCFAPTEQSRDNLLAEGIPEERIEVTGNTVVDALERHKELARERTTALADLGLDEDDYAVMTLHRAENVDDPERFRALLFGASRAGDSHGLPVVYPIHPRARERIEEFDITVPEPIRLVEPREYLEFIRLEDAASIILTDSGGVQEEACILGTPCVTLRDNTERPETISAGANVLAGPDPATIIHRVEEMIDTDGDWENPFGDGTAGEQILQAVTRAPEEVPQ
ncbi:UDP-N-acetylglucosamine 2-epimerase (non-hydrolyzing) [Halovenus sp. WSH3]|uniref:UDP-N-acetylglucosamine 2-epimerase (Non-hydrolyzing) n=1 Tax=Halovenus carboxidivorans TaxID=2692199 RepID=A0A6B0TCL7_9EURY|nr:UDP-N-acetylglucosamine 2-epimerase (non-hydrolyzing) [Halovenus carboxidivorans]MXR52981.1 UDP-N-acetylglucosamine 2-epimerase (non-hydrolyzing) [Halovenus carboxidivorans]